MRLVHSLATLIPLLFFGGCGLRVPSMMFTANDRTESMKFVTNVMTHVRCQLREAVIATYKELNQPGTDIGWLRDWSAQITLTMNVDEKTDFNPGVTPTKLFPDLRTRVSNGDILVNPRSFDLGLGGSLASTATREFEITWFVVFKELFGETYWLRQECRDKDKPFIEGDLRIYDALFAGAYSGSLLRNASDPFAKGGRLQVIQHTVSFHIEASGSATPTWKFVELSANTDAPFIEASRTRKDTLLITMGPAVIESIGRPLKGPVEGPSRAVENSHFAKQIGTAISNSVAPFR